MAEPAPLTGDADWNQAGRREDVLSYFAGWTWSWLDVPGLISGTTEILEYPMVDRDPLPTWGHGRVSLLGDAAHPMYPVGANGASQAIIDAGVLADEVARAADPVTGLANYEDRRRAATTAVVLANREMHHAGRATSADRAGDLAAITARYQRATEAAEARPGLRTTFE